MENICMLCNKAKESVRHLLPLCKFFWNLLGIFLKFFGVEWVVAGSLEEVLHGLDLSGVIYKLKVLWCLLLCFQQLFARSLEG